MAGKALLISVMSYFCSFVSLSKEWQTRYQIIDISTNTH